MQREQSLGAAVRAAGGAADELVDGRVEREGAGLDFFAQRVPGRESVLARHRRLGVVQRQIPGADVLERRAGERGQRGESPERPSVARLRRVEQRLRLLLQLSRFGCAGSCT